MRNTRTFILSLSALMALIISTPAIYAAETKNKAPKKPNAISAYVIPKHNPIPGELRSPDGKHRLGRVDPELRRQMNTVPVIGYGTGYYESKSSADYTLSTAQAPESRATIKIVPLEQRLVNPRDHMGLMLITPGVYQVNVAGCQPIVFTIGSTRPSGELQIHRQGVQTLRLGQVVFKDGKYCVVVAIERNDYTSSTSLREYDLTDPNETSPPAIVRPLAPKTARDMRPKQSELNDALSSLGWDPASFAKLSTREQNDALKRLLIEAQSEVLRLKKQLENIKYGQTPAYRGSSPYLYSQDSYNISSRPYRSETNLNAQQEQGQGQTQGQSNKHN